MILIKVILGQQSEKHSLLLTGCLTKMINIGNEKQNDGEQRRSFKLALHANEIAEKELKEFYL